MGTIAERLRALGGKGLMGISSTSIAIEWNAELLALATEVERIAGEMRQGDKVQRNAWASALAPAEARDG